MCDSSKMKGNDSTPERKKEYIQRWLEDNSFINARLKYDTREKTPPDLFPINNDLLEKTESKATSCAAKGSPVLGGKRTASSPIIGGRKKISKKMKIVQKLYITDTKGIKSSNSTLESTKKLEIPILEKNECNIEKINKLECSHTSTSPVKINQNDIFDSDKTYFSKFFTVDENASSQLIESLTSEEKSNDNSIINVQEVHSDSDKTESDLIEEISTQLIIESTHCEKSIPPSQNISNPSSHSSQNTNYVPVKESSLSAVNSHLQSIETFTPSYPIDSTSTTQSKLDLAKTSYILHCTNEKEKRKKNPKKGSLLDILITAMAKERSSINLLRHQLQKKLNVVVEKPFILLQILQHLPLINNNQFFKCVLVKDDTNLLSDLLVDKNNRLINIMNVPEISNIVNVNQKPMLKVYEPWVVLDPNDLCLHITKFIAISSTNLDENNICNYIEDKNLKIIHEFHCSCIDEKMLSMKCQSKFTDNSNDTGKTFQSFW